MGLPGACIFLIYNIIGYAICVPEVLRAPGLEAG